MQATKALVSSINLSLTKQTTLHGPIQSFPNADRTNKSDLKQTSLPQSGRLKHNSGVRMFDMSSSNESYDGPWFTVLGALIERECHTRAVFVGWRILRRSQALGLLIRVSLHTKTPPQSYLRIAHARSLPNTPPSRCFLHVFLKIAGPLDSTLSCSTPFWLLVRPAGKQAPQVIWLHRQAAGSSHSLFFASEPLPFIFILRDISALFPDPVTRLHYMVPVGCPHT